MCGIAGIVSDQRERALRIAARMLDVQKHRGPDGHGLWQSEGCYGNTVIFGHRRLSILDLSDASAQPMADSTGKFVVTFNGEIYNFLEIRSELESHSVSFRTSSDTEVLLEAYKHWGCDCVDHLNGMFAFAIYDQRRNKLFCARDRYGEKPFLFHSGSGFFAFASEYKGLLQHPDISMEVDDWRLIRNAQNASTGLDSERQTLFKSVQQLLPGEAMEVDVATQNLRVWRYWQIVPARMREVTDEQALFEEFRDLLIDSVRLRLRSDVPVGSCLSGGLDSSAIVCIVRKLLGEDAPYHTFTGRFPGTSADEWCYAEQIVVSAVTVSHVVEPTVDQFVGDMPNFLWLNELPVGSSSQFAQWCVFKLAKERGVTVLLDGQGADEGLGGYEQYFARYIEALRDCGDSDRLNHELPLIRERYPLALTPPARAFRDRLPFRLRHLLSNRLGIGTNVLYGLRQDVARRISQENLPPRAKGFNPLANALLQDSFGRFLTTLLRYGDRNSMAHSREVRLPFCDHRIAEFVFRLPPQLLMGGVQTKRLIRESMRGLLPEPVRTRWNKRGFRPPQDLWFKSRSFQALARDTLSSSHFKSSPYWENGWCLKALERIERGESGLAWTVWQPLMTEWWNREFLQRLGKTRSDPAVREKLPCD